MASSKAPKHDFAPAWLKIPASESPKPSGSKTAEHGDKSTRPRRDDFHGSFNRYGPSEYMYGPLQRQRSFDSYYDGMPVADSQRRYSPQKFRHHSGDEEHFTPPYGYNYGYNYNYEKFNNHYRSQPALFRDSKYQHPNSRYGQVNGAFPPPPPPPPPPYYEPYFYDYYQNDQYYNSYMRVSSGGQRKRYPSGDKDGKSQLKLDKDKDAKALDGDMNGKKPENLDEEFPSLNGDCDGPESKLVKPVPSSGVWDKGPSAKLVNGKGVSSNGDNQANNISDGQSKDSSNRQQNSNIYKALIPTKAPIRKGKDSVKLIGPGKDLNSNHPGPLKSSSTTSPYKVLNNKDSNKDGSCQPSTSPIEILNTRLVTTPKNLADKKSEFLKALREEKTSNTKNTDLNETNCSRSNDKHKGTVMPKQPMLTNGAAPSGDDPAGIPINDLRITPSRETGLSSSLEAEQRLLREMGWSETDDEEYVITEDEKREFEKLSKQLKEQRNGFKKTLPITWSPQHLTTYQQQTLEGDDSTSSLSEDSDLE